MFVNVGRFHFRPMGEEAWQELLRRIERDFAPIPRGCPGFRGVYFVRPSDDELMTVWLWDSPEDWQVGLARSGPFLQQHVIPNLAGAPDRVGANAVIAVTP